MDLLLNASRRKYQPFSLAAVRFGSLVNQISGIKSAWRRSGLCLTLLLCNCCYKCILRNNPCNQTNIFRLDVTLTMPRSQSCIIKSFLLGNHWPSINERKIRDYHAHLLFYSYICSRHNDDWTWIFCCVGRQEEIVIVVLATYRSKFRFLQMAFKLLCLCKTCILKKELAHFSLFWGLLLLLWLQRGISEIARSGENPGQHACEQIDDRQQVSKGWHFMELLVS